jgi:hypothetical protein
MKIEESFRNMKSLLHLDAIMNKTQANMEQMVAWVMLAFAFARLSDLLSEAQIRGLTAQPICAHPPVCLMVADLVSMWYNVATGIRSSWLGANRAPSAV